jgi:wobble nucleotide-excising tRNase
VLSIYPGFLAAYQNRELAFDETYFDLCFALSGAPLRGPRGDAASKLWRPLAEYLRTSVSLEGDRFYLFSDDDGIIEAHLAAEGFRKIATLMHLIANGSLLKNSVLFWDEPEANLNPKLVKIVADFLLRLAAYEVQVFVATHDYLLINELSLIAEYPAQAASDAPIRFFIFSRVEGGGVEVRPGATLAELDANPIMEEFEALYDRERRLFYERDRVD